MSSFKGTIIEESLEDKNVLDKIKILATKVERVNERHKTPWLKKWTLHKVEIPESKAREIAEELSRALDSKHGGSWYADFKNSSYHYIIFRGKIFFIEGADKQGHDKARGYGLALGIPEYQVDFSPDIR